MRRATRGRRRGARRDRRGDVHRGLGPRRGGGRPEQAASEKEAAVAAREQVLLAHETAIEDLERVAAERAVAAEAVEQAAAERLAAAAAIEQAVAARVAAVEGREKVVAERDAIGNARERIAVDAIPSPTPLTGPRSSATGPTPGLADATTWAANPMTRPSIGHVSRRSSSAPTSTALWRLPARDGPPRPAQRDRPGAPRRRQVRRCLHRRHGLKGVNDRNGHAAGDRVSGCCWRRCAPTCVLRPDRALWGRRVRVRHRVDHPDEVQHRIGVIDQSLRQATGVGITAGLAELTPSESLDDLTARATPRSSRPSTTATPSRRPARLRAHPVAAGARPRRHPDRPPR